MSANDFRKCGGGGWITVSVLVPLLRSGKDGSCRACWQGLPLQNGRWECILCGDFDLEYPHVLSDQAQRSRWVLMAGTYNNYDQEGVHSAIVPGSVSLYKLSENSPARLTAFLKSPVPVQYGYFGYSLDLQGNQLLVGAYQEDSERSADSGAAYLFEISEDGKPTLIERFTHPQAKASDRFGTSVGVSGRNLVIGADQFDLPNERWNAGQAIIFYRASE